MSSQLHLREEYLRNGVVLVKNLFDPQVLNNEVSKFISTRAESLVGRSINYVGEQINSIHGIGENEENFFSKLAQESKILNIVSELLGDDAEFRKAELFLKPARLGLASPYHQDDFYWCVSDHNALTVWVALDEVDSTNGGVEFFMGSHKLGLLPHENSYAPGSSQKISNWTQLDLGAFPVKVFNLKPGDCTVHHSLTIHGSSPNISEKNRRGLTIQYKAKTSKYDLSRKKLYEENLQKQLKLRGQTESPQK